MVSNAVISQYLEDLEFPASKSDVIRIAQERKASMEVLETLNKMPGEKYSSMASIWRAIGQID